MDLAALRTQQQQLAASVERADRLDRDPPALIGGADVGFEQEGEITRAAMVLLTWPELELVEYQVARVATSMPYIPGFLSFRETPALLAPLMDKNEQLAWVWRSKVRCNPLFISTGHRVGMDSALMWVERCMRGYRLPEPTRWADAVASRRPSFVRWQANHS